MTGIHSSPAALQISEWLDETHVSGTLFVADDTQESFDYIKRAISTAQAQGRIAYRDELLFTLHDINTPQGMERARLFYSDASTQGDKAIVRSLEETTRMFARLNTPAGSECDASLTEPSPQVHAACVTDMGK